MIKQFKNCSNREILSSYFISNNQFTDQQFVVTVNDKINWYSLHEDNIVQQFHLYGDCERLLWNQDHRILVSMDWNGILYIVKKVDSSQT